MLRKMFHNSRLWLLYTTILLSTFVLTNAPVLFFPKNGFAVLLENFGALPSLAIMAAPIVGIVRNKPKEKAIWITFAVMPFIVLISGIASKAATTSNFQTFAAFLNVLSILPTIAFLLLVLRRRRSGSGSTGFIDATVIAVAAFLVSWVFIIGPNAQASTVTSIDRAMYITLAVMDIVTVWLCMQMAFDGGRRSAAYNIMKFSFSGSAIMDVLLVGTSVTIGVTPLEMGLLIILRNIMAITTLTLPLHPSMKLLMDPGVSNGDETVNSRLRICFVTAASLVSPILLVVEYLRHSTDELLVVAFGSALMLLLVVARMEGMIRSHVKTNVTLSETLQMLKSADIQVRHAQKLQAVGKLAAGIAHEINTPMQYIGDNLRFLQDAFDSINSTCLAYREYLPEEIEQSQAEQIRSEDYLSLADEVPSAFHDSLTGINKVTEIVSAMKTFGSADNANQSKIDINEAIHNIVTVSHSEIESVADVITDLGKLEPLLAFAGDINQVILNLLMNAAQAVRSAGYSADHRGTITIRTVADGDHTVLSIQDNGIGMSEELKDRIFEPFFTTHEVGGGTGQGLALVWNVVVERHYGLIDVESVVGEGTTFSIRLPVLSLSSAASA